jgi:hypothetical protein
MMPLRRRGHEHGFSLRGHALDIRDGEPVSAGVRPGL